MDNHSETSECSGIEDLDEESDAGYSTISDLALEFDDLVEYENPLINKVPLITSTISSNILELIFSEVQGKCQNPSDYQFFSILAKAIRCVNIEHLDDINRSFTLIKTKKSKHYRRLNIKFSSRLPLPNNELPSQIIKRDEVSLLLRKLNKKSKQFKLRQKSDVVVRTNLDILCSICGKSYAIETWFHTHLQSVHKLKPEIAQYISKTITCTQSMTNAIRQKINRRDRLTIWIKEQAKTRKEDVFDSSQQNESQDININASSITLPSLKVVFPEGLNNIQPNHITDSQNVAQIITEKQVKKIRKKTKCSECGKVGNRICGQCKKCCLTRGGCTEHSLLFSYTDLSQFDVVILDTETTDFYAINVSKQTTIEFNNFIKPRTKIERQVVELTGISNEMVRNGTKEFNALDEISQKLGPKVIIIAHNASFDRDAILKSMIYWKRKKRISNFKSQQFIFVDSLALFKGNENLKKKLLKHDKPLQSNKLGDIYKAIIGSAIENQHRAKSDVEALYKCLSHQWMFENDRNLIKQIKEYVANTPLSSTNYVFFNDKAKRLSNSELMKSSALNVQK